jgi:integrase
MVRKRSPRQEGEQGRYEDHEPGRVGFRLMQRTSARSAIGRRTVRRLAEEAGLPPIRPHDLRHGAARLAASLDAVVYRRVPMRAATYGHPPNPNMLH